jgi:hypothetical protein
VEIITLKKKLSKAEFRRRADDILGRLAGELAALPDDTASKMERLRLAAASPMHFMQTYLPHYFPAILPHSTMSSSSSWTGGRGRGRCWCRWRWPRPGSSPRPPSPPSAMSCTRSILKKRHFIIIGSDTEDLASDLTGYLYLEMLYNERLKAGFRPPGAGQLGGG